MGPIGIRRLHRRLVLVRGTTRGRSSTSTELRTAGLSDDLEARNAPAEGGDGGKWCIFDSILSVAYGYAVMLQIARRAARISLPASGFFLDRALQQYPRRRTPGSASRLLQVRTTVKRGSGVPNDITPLLWTQADLRLAWSRWRAA